MADDLVVIYQRFQPKTHTSEQTKMKQKCRRGTKSLMCEKTCNEEQKLGLKTLNYDSFQQKKEETPFCKNNIMTTETNKGTNTWKKKRKTEVFREVANLNSLTTQEFLEILAKKRSTPEMNYSVKELKLNIKKSLSDEYVNANNPYRTKFVVNTVLLNPNSLPPEWQRLFKHPIMQVPLRIYRCQLNTTEETCCCSCNSDAMFEVMKGLYDCYKKKNCDNCNCVLCGPLSQERQILAEKQKSQIDVGVETKSMKLKKAKAAGYLTTLEGKTPEQKEKIIRGLAQNGLLLPEGKTPSERKLIEKVRKDLGLPPEPTTDADKKKYAKAQTDGLITPLEGKTPQQKEKILRGLLQAGIPLPEGRTASEKALIKKMHDESKPAFLKGIPSEKVAKAKAAGLLTTLDGKTPDQKEKILRGLAQAGLPLPKGKTTSEKALIKKIQSETKPAFLKGIPSEKVAKAKAAGLLTPLDGKTPEKQEKILRGLAQAGIPLPEGKTLSQRKLIEKVRKDLGLPPEPKSDADKKKYAKAQADGLITPLEGKTPEQKEKILRGLAQAGMPLPEGRTASEKALIKKVQDESKPELSLTGIPSEKIRKARAAGLITPLAGKTPEQKEKILRGLAQTGIPLPEGKTPSEQKLIDKVRKDLGLPPGPLSDADKKKYAKAQAAGIITPLEGKTPEQKEKVLRRLAEANIPLPEGRTASEKALIKKIQDETRPELSGIPSEKIRKARAAGLITPLAGKTPEQKEKILRGLVQAGIPLPEGKTPSEQNLIDKVRKDLGLPPGPLSDADKKKYAKAQAAGIITPLEGKTPEQKEKVLRRLAEANIPLPEGRTASEKALIKKIQDETRPELSGIPSEKIRKARAAGLITPLAGKTPEQKEKILRGLVQAGIPLPEGKTPSEQKLIDKVRKDLGLPPGPLSDADKKKYAKAQAAGLITPLEGKTPEQKEKVLRRLAEAGIPMPEGRTASEKALIKKVQGETKPELSGIPSEKIRKAQAAGLLTPLAGKTPEQKEKILRGLAQTGIPLPEGKTPSEQKLIDKVRKDLGLPPGPLSDADKKKYAKAQAVGIITPLDGKTPEQKEKVLRRLAEANIPLPEGRTASEKALIKKIQDETRPELSGIPSEKIRKARAAGLITPLAGKTPEQKEKILRGLVQAGIPLPEGKTSSEQNLIDKVRKDLGLPPGPLSDADKKKYAKAQAAGIITPLEGKTPEQKEKVLRRLAEANIPLPEGRTASEKALIKKIQDETRPELSGIPSEKIRKARAAGLITPLAGKTPEQKEKILRGLVQAGIPLPEGKTPSEQNLIDKVRKDLGLPPGPLSDADKKKYAKAQAAGIITPLEGKTPEQKEKVLRRLAEANMPLPEGRTASEKALIKKIQDETRPELSGIPSEKIRKGRAAGLITPLAGKTPEQKEKILRGLVQAGIPLPEGKTPSEQKLIDKVRKDLGLPPGPLSDADKKKYAKAQAAGLITPLEGKTPEQKEKVLRRLAEAGIPMPEGRTASEKALIKKVQGETKPELSGIPSEKIRKAQAAGLLTPLAGKTPEQKEKILRGLAQTGIPLPEGKTPSEQKLIDKVRKDLGLPPGPLSDADKKKYAKAQAVGIITPLEGKTPEQKEKVLRRLAEANIPLPEGRTASEKALIKKIQDETRPELSGIPSEKIRKARAAGLITPLAGKTPEQKEKNLRGLVQAGIPLPEGKTSSEQNLIDKVRKDLGLPPGPLSDADKKKYAKAQAAGIITPLEGKTPAQKEKVLRRLAEAGIPLPEGRTASEKALIKQIQDDTKPELTGITSEKIRKAQAAGLLTPLAGKTPEQKEKILRGLAQTGIPLPEGKTPSEQKLIDKVRKDLGLPPGPLSDADKKKYAKAHAAGIITPLEGKTPEQKEKVLRRLAEANIPLPEGRTASEKALIKKIQNEIKPELSLTDIPSEKIRKAQAAGLLTPLAGKTPEQKEKILRGLAQNGIPLPKGRTPSEQKLIDKVRKDLRLPPGPISDADKKKYAKAHAAGIITPLEGKTPKQKEKVLRRLAEANIPLPEGKTASEKALIKKIQDEIKPELSLTGIPSEKIRKAQAAGLLTPLAGKTPEQKEKIIRGLAQTGIPLPKGRTPSEQKLIDKIRKDLGLPPGPISDADKKKYAKAQAAGIITPLEGKTPEQKEKVLRRLAEAGIPLPEGRTVSEKALIKKIQDETKPELSGIPSEKIRKARAAGLLTPLTGKTPEQKEKILRGLAQSGIPLPEGKTPSERKLIEKVSKDLGLPLVPTSDADKKKYAKAVADGLITPLEGKTPEQKENILRKLKGAGIELPEGRTPSEKSLINKIKASKPVTGLFTPLDGKSPEQKEAIMKKMLSAGVPISEGRTPSEKEIVKKVLLEALKGKSPEDKEKILRSQIQAGFPLPEYLTPSEKALTKRIQDETDKAKKDKAAGLTSLTGKPTAEKERILRELAEAGLPMPEGETPSEKEMVRKVRLAAGLPPDVSPSEAKRYKDMKIGMKAGKKVTKGFLAGPAGIKEELQEIVKMDKCDAACGCDKKKIRFKHSYVKIRVTSPDISSFCPCPNECIPGVKAGVFTDNEGIKVTVGSVMGIPSYLKQHTTSKSLQRSINHTGNLVQSQSLFLLKISCIVTDGLSVGLGSKSTVYIYNSDSEGSVPDIKRALRLYTENTFYDEEFVDDTGKGKSLSCIYRSRFAFGQKHVRYNRNRRHKLLINPKKSCMTDSICSSSSSQSFLIVETEPCLSLSSGSFCSCDKLNVLSTLARHLEYSTDSITSQESIYDGHHDAVFEPFYEDIDCRSVNTLLRNSQSKIIKPVRQSDGIYRTELKDLFGRSEPKLTPKRCRKPQSHYVQNIMDFNQDAPSSRLHKSSSLIIMVSTSAYGDGSSSSQLSDASLQYLMKKAKSMGYRITPSTSCQ